MDGIQTAHLVILHAFTIKSQTHFDLCLEMPFQCVYLVRSTKRGNLFKAVIHEKLRSIKHTY